jgi:DNA-binding MarR family transcriptional regulator
VSVPVRKSTIRPASGSLGGARGVAAASPPLALSVWVRLMKAHHLLLREARRYLAPDLTLPQFDVMAHLSREPRGLTSVQLSRRLLVSAGNLTGIVGRLQSEGMVSRGAHESDGRATRIRLTAAGRRRMARLAPRHARDIEALLSPVPRGDLVALRELLGRLAGSLESARAPAPGTSRRRRDAGAAAGASPRRRPAARRGVRRVGSGSRREAR